jgi:hypothetical protein
MTAVTIFLWSKMTKFIDLPPPNLIRIETD